VVNYFVFVGFEYFFVIQSMQTVLILESFDFMNLYMFCQVMFLLNCHQFHVVLFLIILVA